MPDWQITKRLQNREKSAVYLLTHHADPTRECVLKCLPLWLRERHSDTDFLRERGTELGTDTVVKCLDFFEETVMRGTRPIAFIVMEHWPATLKSHANALRPLTAVQVRDFLASAVDLSQRLLDETGLVQWDFKPSNILLNTNAGTTVFADYGGIVPLENGPKKAQFTEKFAPPERLLDEPGAGIASLAYSIGLTGYWLIAEKVPHEVVPASQRYTVLSLHGPNLDREARSRHAALLPALRHLTARRAQDRPQSLEAIAQLLNDAL